MDEMPNKRERELDEKKQQKMFLPIITSKIAKICVKTCLLALPTKKTQYFAFQFFNDKNL